jgi:hypothetical protein
MCIRSDGRSSVQVSSKGPLKLQVDLHRCYQRNVTDYAGGSHPVDTSGWLATVSAGIAALAFIVSLRALQLQRAGAQASARQEFDELVRQLWLALSKSFGNVEDSRQSSDGFSAAAEEATGEMQTLALRADEILHPPSGDDTQGVGWRRRLLRLWNPSSERPQPNWFDARVLADSFAQVWDLERARNYWELAGKLAEINPMAKVLTLRQTGTFYYLGASHAELEVARNAFNEAVNILRPEMHGADVAYYQNSVTRFIQAQQEDRLDNTKQAAQYLRESWDLASKVQAVWRRREARRDIAAFVVYIMSDESDPHHSERYEGLPEEIKDEAEKLRIQQQTPDAQQMLDDAWQQGFAAAQQQMFTAQQPSMPPADS